MRYRVEFSDGTTRMVQKSSAKRYIRREDFQLIGIVLRQIAVKAVSSMDWLIRMPPADIKNIEKPERKNLAHNGTRYGNGSIESRAMVDVHIERDTIRNLRERQAWADWAAGVK